ncbi:MAG: RdgB/HAM1 family non-canonical purine NTP pyrophosphatase [Flavobacteriales bacterium]|nr:RdgB/HAM1 family non-canonical purine NTP pyrophosphatase [Flavobacteriales bacterium]
MKLIFASQNQNKVDEIRSICPDGYEIVGLNDLEEMDELSETSETLEGNAIQKAKQVNALFGKHCFADDTGLEIQTLGNEPGVYSARYAGPEKNALKNIQKVLILLANKGNRRAQFRTVVCAIINGEQKLFEGIVEGKITREKRGTNGFGYDPIFVPDGSTKTFAEMTLEEKNKFSHRSRAFGNFMNYLESLKKD